MSPYPEVDYDRIYGKDFRQDKPNNPQFEYGHVVSAEDWLGNRFAVNDFVLYCIGAGRGQMMAIGQVLEIRAEKRKGNRYRYAHPGEPFTRIIPEWTRPGGQVLPERRLVDLDEDWWAITVKVLTSKTSGHYDNEQRTRSAWVNPMNITALPVVAPA